MGRSIFGSWYGVNYTSLFYGHRLSNARFADGSVIQANGAAGQFPKPQEVQLSTPFLATVIILDDDHCGIFNLGPKDIETVESIGVYDVKVTRWSGARYLLSYCVSLSKGLIKIYQEYTYLCNNNITEDELLCLMKRKRGQQKLERILSTSKENWFLKIMKQS